jgi:hypothetical protein
LGGVAARDFYTTAIACVRSQCCWLLLVRVCARRYALCAMRYALCAMRYAPLALALWSLALSSADSTNVQRWMLNATRLAFRNNLGLPLYHYFAPRPRLFRCFFFP